MINKKPPAHGAAYHQRQHSRKLEPIIDQKGLSNTKMIPKPSVSPDLAMAAEGQSMVSLAAQGGINNRVSPFGGGVSSN